MFCFLFVFVLFSHELLVGIFTIFLADFSYTDILKVDFRASFPFVICFSVDRVAFVRSNVQDTELRAKIDRL